MWAVVGMGWDGKEQILGVGLVMRVRVGLGLGLEKKTKIGFGKWSWNVRVENEAGNRLEPRRVGARRRYRSRGWPATARSREEDPVVSMPKDEEREEVS